MKRFVFCIAISCFAAGAVLNAQAPRAATTPQEKLAREIYEELVEINTADSTGGIFSLPGETNAHGRDEKLRTKSFYDGLAFLDALVRRLATK